MKPIATNIELFVMVVIAGALGIPVVPVAAVGGVTSNGVVVSTYLNTKAI
jgi:hypothetical protein